MGDIVRLTLMNQDTPVMEFSYHTGAHVCTDIRKIMNPEYASPALLRTDGSITEDTFNAWWQRRAIPITRSGLDFVLDTLNITDPRTLLDMNHGLSLSDRYWVNSGSLKWTDINYFDNDFSDDLGMVTLHSQVPERVKGGSLALLNPSSSLNGNMKKKWSIDPDGSRVLYKKSANPMALDVYGEAVATALHKYIFDPDEYISYEIRCDKDGIYAVCPNMLHDNEEFIPAFDILINDFSYSRNTYQGLLKRIHGLGLGRAGDFLNRMFVCDFIIGNDDRHYNNFGFIRDVETLEYLSMAPVFDSGNSLWNREPIVKAEKSSDYYTKPFGSGIGEKALEQMANIQNLSCIDYSTLSSFFGDAAEILFASELIPEKRCEDTLEAMKHQVNILQHLAME
ncbi:MAG: hypothetical protein LUE92_18100 [Clostridiales bacterium]|nr:hypothetical protein [Clostridiales bacterium]